MRFLDASTEVEIWGEVALVWTISGKDYAGPGGILGSGKGELSFRIQRPLDRNG